MSVSQQLLYLADSTRSGTFELRHENGRQPHSLLSISTAWVVKVMYKG